MVLIDKHSYLSKEEIRLKEDKERSRYWKKWGPYVAERQWATGEAPMLSFLTAAIGLMTSFLVSPQFARITRQFSPHLVPWPILKLT